VLHNFASPPRGAYPDWGVIRDSAGNLYGTTNGSFSDVGGGGTRNAGVVFEVDIFGNETVLYSFTGEADGSSPNGVIRDSAGNLYGSTAAGGASGAGVVFKLDASAQETVLYNFTGGADGGNPPDLWSATQPATSTGLLRVAVTDSAWCSKSIRLAMRPCCTASRAGTMAATPTQV